MAITPTYLIKKADFAPYIDIAANLSDSKLNPRILEAQMFDLKPLLGVELYDTLPITDFADYITPVLVYFAAARLVKSLDLHITPNGLMTKRNEYSDHVDTKAIAYKVTEYEQLALAYWGEAVTYLNDNKKEYPLYIGFSNGCGCDNRVNNYRPTITAIKGKGTGYGYR